MPKDTTPPEWEQFAAQMERGSKYAYDPRSWHQINALEFFPTPHAKDPRVYMKSGKDPDFPQWVNEPITAQNNQYERFLSEFNKGKGKSPYVGLSPDAIETKHNRLINQLFPDLDKNNKLTPSAKKAYKALQQHYKAVMAPHQAKQNAAWQADLDRFKDNQTKASVNPAKESKAKASYDCDYGSFEQSGIFQGNVEPILKSIIDAFNKQQGKTNPNKLEMNADHDVYTISEKSHDGKKFSIMQFNADTGIISAQKNDESTYLKMIQTFAKLYPGQKMEITCDSQQKAIMMGALEKFNQGKAEKVTPDFKNPPPQVEIAPSSASKEAAAPKENAQHEAESPKMRK